MKKLLASEVLAIKLQKRYAACPSLATWDLYLTFLGQIAEILETGDLRRIGYERTEDVEVARLFQGIYGVGE